MKIQSNLATFRCRRITSSDKWEWFLPLYCRVGVLPYLKGADIPSVHHLFSLFLRDNFKIWVDLTAGLRKVRKITLSVEETATVQPVASDVFSSYTDISIGRYFKRHTSCCHRLKGKAILVTRREGPYDCETSRLPHFSRQSALWAKVVSLTLRLPFTLRKIPGTHFC
jgi:hypothetical protein